MTQPVPPIQRRFSRSPVTTAMRRGMQAIANSANNPTKSDIINDVAALVVMESTGSSQTINSGVTAGIAFGSSVINPSGWWTIGDTITVPTTGYYRWTFSADEVYGSAAGIAQISVSNSLGVTYYAGGTIIFSFPSGSTNSISIFGSGYVYISSPAPVFSVLCVNGSAANVTIQTVRFGFELLKQS